MKVRCKDGLVRAFKPAYCDGDRLPNGARQDMGNSESRCLLCGEAFGVHDTKVLLPHWRNHICKINRKGEGK